MVKIVLRCLGFSELWRILVVGFAERTFVVLDKRLVAGEFVHGDPHVEGLANFVYPLFYLFISFCSKGIYLLISLLKFWLTIWR